MRRSDSPSRTSENASRSVVRIFTAPPSGIETRRRSSESAVSSIASLRSSVLSRSQEGGSTLLPSGRPTVQRVAPRSSRNVMNERMRSSAAITPRSVGVSRATLTRSRNADEPTGAWTRSTETDSGSSGTDEEITSALSIPTRRTIVPASSSASMRRRTSPPPGTAASESPISITAAPGAQLPRIETTRAPSATVSPRGISATAPSVSLTPSAPPSMSR